MQHPILSIIGAGGKTTALLALARVLAGQRVLLTTSTHIYPVAPPQSRALLIDPDADELLDALRIPGIVCAGTDAGAGKLGALAPDLFRRAVQATDITLCEADGAHHLPLKLHRADEPVVPLDSARCVIVAGLSAWGLPVGGAVHRFALHPDWVRDPARLVGADEILYCVREAAGSCRLPRERVRVVLNQADTPALRAQAAPLTRLLAREGLPCRAGSLQAEADVLAQWCLDGL